MKVANTTCSHESSSLFTSPAIHRYAVNKYARPKKRLPKEESCEDGESADMDSITTEIARLQV